MSIAPKELKLCSPVGAEAIVYHWPLCRVCKKLFVLVFGWACSGDGSCFYELGLLGQKLQWSARDCGNDKVRPLFPAF